MKLHDDTGAQLSNVLDGALKELQARYDIPRKDARKLLAEAIIRTCVWDEIISMCDWQMEKEAEQ